MNRSVPILKDISYHSVDDQGVFKFIDLVRKGLSSDFFYNAILTQFSFSLSDWAIFLHLSERTLQRYRTEHKTFEPVQSEKILELTMLFSYGISVFGDKANFETWLESTSVALGTVKPKDLLDTSYGINLLRDELTRIEHGVLA